jgi:universal stress protein E
MRIQRILVPTDFTADSDGAIRLAAGIARAFGAALVLFHGSPGADSSDEPPLRLREDVHGLFEESLVACLSPDALAGVTWTGMIGDAVDMGQGIADAATLVAADLIVMRSRRRPFRAALLGSTAETVCRVAPCPVLVSHPDEEGVSRFSRILVAYDYSSDSEVALKEALALAEASGAEIHVLSVLPPRSGDEPGALPSLGDAHLAYVTALERLELSMPDASRNEIVCSVRSGRVYRVILEYAEEVGADLICMGVRGAGYGAKALFGSNVDRVVRQSPCPTLIARPLRHASASFVGHAAARLESA